MSNLKKVLQNLQILCSSAYQNIVSQEYKVNQFQIVHKTWIFHPEDSINIEVDQCIHSPNLVISNSKLVIGPGWWYYLMPVSPIMNEFHDVRKF